jgi:hypothetical protein
MRQGYRRVDEEIVEEVDMQEERSGGGGNSEVEAVGIGWSYFGGVGFTKR